MSDTKPIDDGGNAFPRVRETLNPIEGLILTARVDEPGMSLADHIAVEALAHLPLLITTISETGERDFTRHKLNNTDWIAGAAYQLADALIAEKRRREQSR